MTHLVLVAARGENGVIGSEGDLPWRLPSDLKRFKQVTLGKPIIMGRKTWESLPRKPLPGRPNIIVSRTLDHVEDAEVFNTIEAAITAGQAHASRLGVDEVCVIGGGALYAAMIDQADRLYLTDVALSPEGETRFPDLNPDTWMCVSEERHEPGPGDDAGFTLRVWERRRE